MIGWEGQGDAGFTWIFGVRVPFDLPCDAVVAVLVVQFPLDLGVSGEEGSEYERVCDEGNVLWDEKVVIVVQDDHGDD